MLTTKYIYVIIKIVKEEQTNRRKIK